MHPPCLLRDIYNEAKHYFRHINKNKSSTSNIATMKLLSILTLSTAALALPSPNKGNGKTSVRGKNFQQWGFLILENTDYTTAEANPTFQSIQNLNNNRLLSQYFGVEHPSLPNYLATIAGTTFGVKDDRSPATYNFTGSTILDLLEKKGVSWKMYAENYPGGCSTAATDGLKHSYAAKHVPAVYFRDITTNPSRCANVVPATEFQTDIDSGSLPQWWYYVPTLNNDGHDTDTAFVANYLETEWVPRFKNKAFTKDLAMVMTYDESETYSAPNHVYAALIGDALKPVPGGNEDATVYNHYSLMRTVEDNWELGSLGRNDTGATAINTGVITPHSG